MQKNFTNVRQLLHIELAISFGLYNTWVIGPKNLDAVKRGIWNTLIDQK